MPARAAAARHTRASSADFVVGTRYSEFVDRPGFWIMYAFMVCGAWSALRVVMPWAGAAVIWTTTLQAHAAVTFVLLHWIRGAPEALSDLSSSDVAHLTFWEQIGGGRVWGTKPQRVFTLFPIAIFFLTLIWTQENMVMLVLNSLSTVVLLIAKSESLFGVRLFGINKLQE